MATEPMYYAKDGVVWKSPERNKQPDGSTVISIGFPVCTMHDAVGPEAAETVAALMNIGDAHDPSPSSKSPHTDEVARG